MNPSRDPGRGLRSRHTRAPALVSASFLVAALVTGAAWAGPTVPEDPGPIAAFGAEPNSSSVTLITGDRIHLEKGPDGRLAASIETAARRDGTVPQVHLTTRDDQLYAVPADVAHLVPDLLDPELFNVPSLVEQGYDDTRPTIPLIVSYEGAVNTQPRPVPGGTRLRVLPNAREVAIEASKDELGDFADAVRLLGTTTSASRNGADAGPLAGVEKIWLDQRVQAQLDRSAEQVFVAEEEHFDLTLTAIARDGRPTRPWGSPFSFVVDVQTGAQMIAPCSTPPTGLDRCVRVPRGTYSVLSYIYTKPAWLPEDGSLVPTVLHTALVGDPELEVTADTTVVLDARDAVEIEIDTPAHRTKANLGAAAQLTWTRTSAAGTAVADFALNSPGSQLEERLFIQPMDKVSVGELAVTSRWRLEVPAISFTADVPVELNPHYYRMDHFSGNSWQYPRLDGKETLRVVDAGEGRPDDVVASDLDGALALIRRSDDVAVSEQSNAAAAADARLVAIYNDQPGLNANPGSIGEHLRVPTVRLSHDEGVGLLEALGAGPVIVRAEGLRASPYVYDLVYAELGGVPETLHYTADSTGLARIDRAFHSQVTDEMTFTEASYAFQPWDAFSITAQLPLLGAPRERVDYHVPDPGVRWSYGVWSPERTYNHTWPQPPSASLKLDSPRIQYSPGVRRERAWFRQPLRPGFDVERPVTRSGDLLRIPIAGLVDADGNFAATSSSTGLDAHFQVWRGDQLLAETRAVAAGTILLPAAEDTYRIVYDIDNDSSWARLSTKTRTEWTFTSKHTDSASPQPVALMTLAYDLDVDLRNRLASASSARGPLAVDIVVGDQAGVQIPVGDVSFEVSYDDGLHWRERPARRLGAGAYRVTLGGAPKDAEHASFRVSARDANGNRIDQEIVRAATLPKAPVNPTRASSR